RRRILDIDRGAARAVDPFAVDVELRLAREGFLHRSRILGLGAVDSGHLVHVRSFPETNPLPASLANRSPTRHSPSLLSPITIDAGAIAWLGAGSSLQPLVVVGPLAAVLADRFHPRRAERGGETDHAIGLQRAGMNACHPGASVLPRGAAAQIGQHGRAD